MKVEDPELKIVHFHRPNGSRRTMVRQEFQWNEPNKVINTIFGSNSRALFSWRIGYGRYKIFFVTRGEVKVIHEVFVFDQRNAIITEIVRRD
ncbi:hypothetical protein YC2023_106714 [Brassica napus]